MTAVCGGMAALVLAVSMTGEARDGAGSLVTGGVEAAMVEV